MAKISEGGLKRGIFPLVADIQAAINSFIEESNGYLRSLIWITKLADFITALLPSSEGANGWI